MRAPGRETVPVTRISAGFSVSSAAAGRIPAMPPLPHVARRSGCGRGRGGRVAGSRGRARRLGYWDSGRSGGRAGTTTGIADERLGYAPAAAGDGGPRALAELGAGPFHDHQHGHRMVPSPSPSPSPTHILSVPALAPSVPPQSRPSLRPPLANMPHVSAGPRRRVSTRWSSHEAALRVLSAAFRVLSAASLWPSESSLRPLSSRHALLRKGQPHPPSQPPLIPAAPHPAASHPSRPPSHYTRPPPLQRWLHRKLSCPAFGPSPLHPPHPTPPAKTCRSRRPAGRP